MRYFLPLLFLALLHTGFSQSPEDEPIAKLHAREKSRILNQVAEEKLHFSVPKGGGLPCRVGEEVGVQPGLKDRFYAAKSFAIGSDDKEWNWISTYNPDEEEESEEEAPTVVETLPGPSTPSEMPRWYFVAKPGFYYLTDSDMRTYFHNGGFTIRGEFGYRIWKPFYVWFDGGYFEKKGKPIGGSTDLKMQMASITLGFKAIGYLHERFALYAGAGPRVLMTVIHNNSPFVRERDDGLGIGGGFIGGFWVFPFPQTNEIFFDFFADYTLNQINLEEDLVSSYDNDINASGLSFGVGVGVRF